MNILLIGNGFDLAHGLPTSYGDFLDYVENPSNPKRKEMKENVWIDGFQNSRTSIGSNWIDLEGEIALIIQNLDFWYKNSTEVGKSNIPPEYKLLFKEITLMGHAKSIKNVAEILLTELNQFIHYLDDYLQSVTYLASELISPDIKDLEIHKVLSFNYTDTYQKIYDKEENVEYDFVHGKIGSQPNNMVLGIDEYLSREEKSKKLDFVRFKKYFQRIQKRTGCTYKQWFEQIKESWNEWNREPVYDDNSCDNEENPVILGYQCPPDINLYIYGHSLDVTDKDILSELISHEHIKTTIFYLDDESYAEKITNLIKIIGQDNVIKFVHGTNPKIKFQLQQEMVDAPILATKS